MNAKKNRTITKKEKKEEKTTTTTKKRVLNNQVVSQKAVNKLIPTGKMYRNDHITFTTLHIYKDLKQYAK